MEVNFILQVRTGSKRLPNKMMMPFYEGLTIPEIIIKKLLGLRIEKCRIIIATTINPIDDALVALLSTSGCSIFRGNEENVLQRFIDAALQTGSSHFFRICADNPFLNTDFIEEIIPIVLNNHFDYVSYKRSDETPAIRTHYGFFCEYTTLHTLQRVQCLSSNKIDTEHVTPYIYNNPGQFVIKLQDMPWEIENNNWLRLTIDTQDDFLMAQKIFAKLPFSNNYQRIIEEALPFKDRMSDIIVQQSK